MNLEYENNLVQAVYVPLTVDASTTSTTYVNLLSSTINTIGGDLIVMFSANAANSNANRSMYWQIVVDGVVVEQAGSFITTAGYSSGITMLVKVPGTGMKQRTVALQWCVSNNTGNIRPVTAPNDESAEMIIFEVLN
jgi:hypothetical protein